MKEDKVKRTRWSWVAGTLLLVPMLAEAMVIKYSFTDPIGDTAPTIDLIGLDFEFEDRTGAYTIDVHASAAKPFFGPFRTNINIFNPDTGSIAAVPAVISG